MASINEQIKHGEDLLQGHIGELAVGYEYLYKTLEKGFNYYPDPNAPPGWEKLDINEALNHLAIVAPKVACLYRDWEGALGGDDMPHIIEELETIVW